MDRFDYVVVGAGTSGSIVAGRLADIPGNRICVLEAGPSERNLFVHIPAGFLKMRSSARHLWSFNTEPGAALGGRSIPMIQGRLVGGSGSINGMVYARGQAADFDNWARLGNKGWSYSELLPFFRASERHIGVSDERLRGRDGRVTVSNLLWRDPLTDAFIDAGVALGLPRNNDYNGESHEGMGRFQFMIDQAGWRASTARTFLRPAVRSRRVELRTEAQVTGLIFEGTRVVGVRYRRPGSPDEVEVRANKEVILCAGTAHTPKLLQLSGIGPASLLQGLGIDVVKDVPGVGENLQDHFVSRMVFRVKGASTVNQLVNGPAIVGQALRWLLRQPNIIGMGPVLGHAFCKSSPDLDAPDYCLNFTPGSFAGNNIKLDSKPGMTLNAYQLRPASTGYVRARSRNPEDLPGIQPNYFSAETDQRVSLEAIKTVRRIVGTPPLAQYCDTELSPGASVRTDADFIRFMREGGQSGHHIVGTCKMGPDSDPLAVVDTELRLRGFSGLRIADASVMPTITSGNTNAPTMMIAEKAAQLILNDSRN